MTNIKHLTKVSNYIGEKKQQWARKEMFYSKRVFHNAANMKKN